MRMKVENLTEINFELNGEEIIKTIPSHILLIDFIREDLALLGTKPGCLEGECGACTVLVNEIAVNSCLYPAINIHKKSLTTIEGLSSNGKMDIVQEALIEHGAVQCGFCTPGMAMTIKSFYEKNKSKPDKPDKNKIKKSIEGNLCRCTGYLKIIEAIESLFE